MGSFYVMLSAPRQGFILRCQDDPPSVSASRPDCDPVPVFSAVLHPHRSLSLRGARLVVVLVALASAVASIPFVVLGFWPVAGFYGIDVLILWLALRASLNEGQSSRSWW